MLYRETRNTAFLNMKQLLNNGLNRKARYLLMISACCGSFFMTSTPASAQSGQPPALVVTNEPLPQELRSKVYNSPSRAPQITPSQISGAAYYDASQTVVGRKVDSLRDDLFDLQTKVADLSERLAMLENSGQGRAAAYYAAVATISTQLQSGTTPGNPRLVERLTSARDNLETLAGNIAALNDLAVEISSAASMASFLLETARATYSLNGAIEEDHIRLAQIEDAVNNTVVVIDRMLNNVNDDITRTMAYLSTERNNLRTLSLAISSGDLFGRSLSSRPFSTAQQASFTPSAGRSLVAPASATGSPEGPRPLVKIRFDRADVSYEQPLYLAVNEAIQRYPAARFELVAVHPNQGNAAQVAIESTRARRNAERVLRSLTQMGLEMERIDLSYAPSPEASSNEVHLFIR
jgi:hypothetical protein